MGILHPQEREGRIASWEEEKESEFLGRGSKDTWEERGQVSDGTRIKGIEEN